MEKSGFRIPTEFILKLKLFGSCGESTRGIEKLKYLTKSMIASSLILQVARRQQR